MRAVILVSVAGRIRLLIAGIRLLCERQMLDR